MDVGSDSVRPAATIQIGAEVVGALWRDGTTLLVIDAAGKLHAVDRVKATPLMVPPAATRDKAGAAWLLHCARNWVGDDDPCAAWVGARISERGVGKVELIRAGPDAMRPGTASAAPPAGIAASLVKDAARVTVRCSADGGKEVTRTWPADTGCEIGEASLRWPASSARFAMIDVGLDCGGEAPLDFTRTLVEVCSLNGLVEVDEIAIGPADVWAHTASVATGRNWTVRHGLAVIGSVQGEATPIFRP